MGVWADTDKTEIIRGKSFLCFPWRLKVGSNVPAADGMACGSCPDVVTPITNRCLLCAPLQPEKEGRRSSSTDEVFSSDTQLKETCNPFPCVCMALKWN